VVDENKDEDSPVMISMPPLRQQQRLSLQTQPSKFHSLHLGGKLISIPIGLGKAGRSFLNANKIYKMRAGYPSDLATNGAGNIATLFNMNPQPYLTEWASLADLFDEFRVVSVELVYSPDFANTTSRVVTQVGVAFDNTDVTAATGHQDLINLPSSRLHSLWYGKGFNYRAKRPNLTASSYWTPTASPTGSTGSLKLWADGNAASTSVGYSYFYFFFEFRMRV